MEVITFQSEAFQQLMSKIDNLSSKIERQSKDQPLSEAWLDVQETCNLLKVSKRTLQSYRDNGVLPFSQISGKIYFRTSDIKEHLQKHYKQAFRK